MYYDVSKRRLVITIGYEFDHQTVERDKSVEGVSLFTTYTSSALLFNVTVQPRSSMTSTRSSKLASIRTPSDERGSARL